MSCLNDEQVEDLCREFPYIRQARAIGWGDLKRASEVVGYPLAGHELRDILGMPRSSISLEEFNVLYAKAQDLRDINKELRHGLILKHVDDVKAFTVGKPDSGTLHSTSKAEERGFSEWINQRLGHDPDLHDILPLNHNNENELYNCCKNGVLLCKLVNIASPDTIDERSINRGPALKHVFNIHENLSLAINSAAAIGCCVVNTGPDDIMQGKKHILLGLIWQLIRRGLVDTITLNSHNELIGLLNEGESASDLMELKPEELLMRWVNKQLHMSGCQRRITNFSADLADSVVYAHLIEQIAPMEKRHCVMLAEELLGSLSRQERAINILNNFQSLGVPTLLSPEDIYLAGEREKENRDRLNLAFIATLFNMYPAMDIKDGCFKDGNIECETLEERTYRNWMNSLGVKPYVSFLDTDLSNGLVLLQLVEKIKPGVVDWSKVVYNFDMKKRIFQEQGNCNMVVDSARQINIGMVNISGEDIRNRNRTLLLGVCFQLMHAYTFKLLYDAAGSRSKVAADDKAILNWVNEQLTEAQCPTVCSFRDPAIATGIPIFNILEQIKPNSTQRNIWMDSDNENFSLCQYAISCCRKAGARTYTLPEHVRDLNGKMIMALFASLQVLAYNIRERMEEKIAKHRNGTSHWINRI